MLTLKVTVAALPASKSTSTAENVTSAPVGNPDTDAVRLRSIVPLLDNSKVTLTEEPGLVVILPSRGPLTVRPATVCISNVTTTLLVIFW